MSAVFGAKESPIGSTRLLNDPPPPDDKKKPRFSLLKWLVDRLFPASALNLADGRGDSPSRE
jgi:hypothetical protein